ncbi:Zn(II)2Cys6 transcription factor [Aspergillus undulatus]|uniref:Zn(II)2Cys6 transcription factor n=1 Tax=Aspergillus undulatus TaxID=1810928 RepID=UPI003CCE03E3
METERGHWLAVSPDFLIDPSFHYSPHPSQDLLTGTTSTPSADAISKALTPYPRTNRVKRPHTKSRRGCYSCKTRRIKCQETKPACANCLHKDLDCVYPRKDREQGLVVAQPQTQVQKQSSASSPDEPSPTLSPSSQLSATPFSGDDLRFWHHFLVDARPHLPFGDESSWLSTIPAFAHECPHLLHAMLSLGASHCSLIAPRGNQNQYASTAIAYRGRALKSLSAILAKGNECTVSEMDGALATCYTLTFQAHHMSDGIVDFAVMVRGCGLVTNWYCERQRRSQIFTIQSREHMSDMILGWLPGEMAPICEVATVNSCLEHLDKLQPHLSSPAHFAFYNSLRACYESLLLSHRHAFTALVSLYAVWGAMENVEFLTFIAPGNHVSRALFINYVTFDALMRPVYGELARERNLGTGGGHFLIYRWADGIFNGLPRSMRGVVNGLMRVLAMALLPGVQEHRGRFPQWVKELEGFVEWLRVWVDKGVLELNNI